MNKLIPVLSLLLSTAVNADSSVYRCTDVNGNTIFSEKICGPNAVVETVKDQYIGEKQKGQSRSAMEQLENYRRSVKETERITGGKKEITRKTTPENPCDRVTSLSLRNARISKDVMKCHSKDDVRSIYGDPKSISNWSDRSAYDTRWKYWSREKGTRYIYFKGGRVTKWSSHK